MGSLEERPENPDWLEKVKRGIMNQKKMGLPAFAKVTVFAGFLVVAFAGCDQLANLKLDMDEGDSKTTLPAGVVDSGCTPVVSVDATTKHFAKEANCDTPMTVYIKNESGGVLDTDNMYFVYSNVTESDKSLAMGSGSGVSLQMMPDIQFSPSMEENPLHPPVPDGVTQFNNDPSLRPPLLLPAPGEAPPPQSPQYNMGSVTVGSTTRNWTDSNYNTVATTLRAYATTYAGNKVYVWIQNGSTMLGSQDVMEKFNGCNVINGGSCTFGEYANSIYKMVRDIAGAEWGSHLYSNLLASTETDVHIVYYDITPDGQPWGILGYYWSANNYMKSSFAASNEALVFFMDAPTYKSGPPGVEKLNGTLAHEFQHMIHFYQRTIKRGVNSPTWMNEMASMTVEDLVATVVGGAGSGPAFGNGSRLARYVQNPNCNLTIWNSGSGTTACTGWQDSYATSYSFGGFMARQYPGFIHHLLTSTQNNMAAVQDAIVLAGYTDTWQTAFSRWGTTFAMNDDELGNAKANYAPGFGFIAQGDLQAVEVWGDATDTVNPPKNANLGVTTKIYSTPPATIRAYSNVIHKFKANDTLANASVLTQENIVLPTGVKLTVVVTP